jgi:hypothetical protein
MNRVFQTLDLSMWLQRFLWRTLRFDRYEVRGSQLALHKGPFEVRILLSADEVVSWQVTPEMAFDIVDVELSDGMSLRLLDEYGDCISGLEVLAGAKRKRS